ncbi:MAG: T9SS type A sorting domain-containing protein [Sphingobacteriales bacterium]|nr:MAG: T9SS type A sorting domain-containing protein [Sphingobacteriales bacterium]
MDTQNNRTYLGITSEEEALVREIAATNTLAAMDARVILYTAFGEEIILALPQLPSIIAESIGNWNVHFKNQGNSNVSSVTVYPNPASDEVCMTYRLSGNRQAEFVLYDFSGMLLQSRQLTGNGLMRFQTHGLSQGIYFYQITLNGKPLRYSKFVLVK